MKKWTHEAMETMLAKHDLFTEDRMEKRMLLAVSEGFI